MVNRLIRVVLLIGLLVSSLFLASRLRGFYWPGNQQDYEPVQPIAFSHQQHAGKLGISCLYCHFGAEKSRHAGFPAASLCMNCHTLVTAPRDDVLQELREAQQAGRPARPVVSLELAKLYNALGLDDKLQPDPKKQPKPIAWVKVHNLPTFTCFDHRPHVADGVRCQHCHGQVENMVQVRQAKDLSMGWCVNCHRDTVRFKLTVESFATLPAAGVPQKVMAKIGPLKGMRFHTRDAFVEALGEKLDRDELARFQDPVLTHARESAQPGAAGKKARPSTDCSACHY